MRVLAAALVAAGVAAGCGDAGASGADREPATRLDVTVWPNGRGTMPVRRYTLRCDPAGGTLPRPARACRELAKARSPLAPVPKDVVCAQIYGGPAEATVTGTYRGRRVSAKLNRRDGCQISRWNRLLPIPVQLPPPPPG